MGVFDRVEEEAENFDPHLAQQQAKQNAAGQSGKGNMKTAQNMIGKQGGAQDQNIDQDIDQDGYYEDEEPDPTQGW